MSIIQRMSLRDEVERCLQFISRRAARNSVQGSSLGPHILEALLRTRDSKYRAIWLRGSRASRIDVPKLEFRNE